MVAVTRQGPGALAQAIDRLQRDLGLSAHEIETVLAVRPEILAGWRSGDVSAEPTTLDRLGQLKDLDHRLRETFEKESVPTWLRTDSRYLGGRTPIKLLLAGRIDRVHAALDALDAGVFI